MSVRDTMSCMPRARDAASLTLACLAALAAPALVGCDDDAALSTPCELEPWRRLARAPFEIARRVAGRLAGCASRCVGSRQLTRALAALIWLTLVAAFMVLLVGLIAMAGVAVFAFCFVLAMGTSFVVTLPLCLVVGGRLTASGQG